MRRYLKLLVVLVLGASALLLGVSTPASGTVSGTNVLYTLDADFDQGTLINVNHDAPNSNQLQLNTESGAFPFIWVSLSQRCTIAKINTETGAILGEYRTLSDSSSCPESSRTTVGLDGSVWVGHRGPGGVTHVGLVELNQCVDRNANGTIETSTAYGDVEAWPGVNAPVTAALDECILHHMNFGGSDSRHMSIDPDGDLWVGDRAGGSIFRKFDTSTGALLSGPHDWNCGGYGGLSDGAGVIWSATSGGQVLRWDPDAPTVNPNTNLPDANPRCIPLSEYGMAIDGNGYVWVSVLSGSTVSKISPDGNTIQTFSKGPGSPGNAQGLAVDGNGDVWISSSLFCSGSGCAITHLKNDGTFVGNVPNPTGGGSTGVAVDADGKIWTANRNANTATRIDPTLGGLGADGVTTIGAVDLTVAFPAGPAGRPLPFPYNYSDMTGSQLLGTAPQGTWTVVQDSAAAGTEWGTITWNTEAQGNVPAGASLTVEARAADTEAGLGSEAYAAVSNGGGFSLIGRFIQVQVTLKPDSEGNSPVLSDIRIQTAAAEPPAENTCGEVRGDGRLSTNEQARFVFYNIKSDGTTVAGEVSFTDLLNKQQKVKFVSTSIDTLVITGNHVKMTGKGTVNGVPVDWVVEGDDGSPDTFSITLSSGYSATGNVASGRGVNLKLCDPPPTTTVD